MNSQVHSKMFSYVVLLSLSLFMTGSGMAQDSQVEKALAYTPNQPDVDCDTPTDDERKDCRVERSDDPPGFTVKDATGRLLRMFTDNNEDNKLDQFSYFKNGVEYYRDIDSNFDGKIDQNRWVGSGGTRLGIDSDQDGNIDEWKFISAEEVAYETFQAIKNRDLIRFRRLMLTPAEFKGLELGTPIATEIQKRWSEAQKNFEEFASKQKQIDSTTEWVQSSHGLPAMVPAGASGNKQDIVVYDHASAVFKGRDFGNLAIGTILQVDKGLWRLIELPELAEEGKVIGNGGALFPLPDAMLTDDPKVASSPNEVELAKMYTELVKLDEDLAAAEKAVEIARLEETKAKLLEKFYELTEPGEQQLNWLKSIADSVSSAYQKERFPDGLKFLDGYMSRLKSAGVKDGLDYIRWRAIYAKYTLATEEGDSRQREEAHDQLIEAQQQFQEEFPTSPIAAEALSSMGIHYEISGESATAIKWYRDLAKRFSNTEYGKRAAGALSRLEGRGKPLAFVGEDIRGNKFNLQDPKYRGKIVVIHFWETWCTDGLDEIQRLAEKFKDDVVFVGCNIENETEAFVAFAKKNPDYFTWTHLHSPGSMEQSPLAQQLGVPSEPLVLIVDKKGNLVEADVAFNDLEREIERQRRK